MSYISDINQLLCEVLHIDEDVIEEDLDLREDLSADEEDLIEIAQLLDDEYNTNILDQLENIIIVGDLYDSLSE